MLSSFGCDEALGLHCNGYLDCSEDITKGISPGHHDETFCECPNDRPHRCQCHEEKISTCAGTGYTCYSDTGKQSMDFLQSLIFSVRDF